MNKLEKNQNCNHKTFEDIKHIDENGTEYWEARELMKMLEYNKWENFEKVINKAKEACENSNISVIEHFPDVRKLPLVSLAQLTGLCLRSMGSDSYLNGIYSCGTAPGFHGVIAKLAVIMPQAI